MKFPQEMCHFRKSSKEFMSQACAALISVQKVTGHGSLTPVWRT